MTTRPTIATILAANWKAVGVIVSTVVIVVSVGIWAGKVSVGLERVTVAVESLHSSVELSLDDHAEQLREVAGRLARVETTVEIIMNGYIKPPADEE